MFGLLWLRCSNSWFSDIKIIREVHRRSVCRDVTRKITKLSLVTRSQIVLHQRSCRVSCNRSLNPILDIEDLIFRTPPLVVIDKVVRKYTKTVSDSIQTVGNMTGHEEFIITLIPSVLLQQFLHLKLWHPEPTSGS